MADSATSLPHQRDDDWSDIEQFVTETAERSRTSQSIEEFAIETIRRTAEILEARVGVLWLSDERGHLQAICASDDLDAHHFNDLPNDDPHRSFLLTVLESNRPQSRLTHATTDKRAAARDLQREVNEPLWIAAPFRLDDQAFGVIEVAQPANLSPAARSGNERLLAMVGDLTVDFLQRRQVDGLKATTDQWLQYEMLAQRAHATLGLQETCFQIVNDGRLFIGCDRASVVVPMRRNFVTQAISGVDTIERRSRLVRGLEELAEAVAKSGQWLRYRGQTDQLPPQLETPVCEYADASHSQSIDVVPLVASTPQNTDSNSSDSERLVGVLVLERFEGREPPGTDHRIIQVSNLSSAALRNALDYQTLPLLGLSKAIRNSIGFGRGHRSWMTAGALFIAMTALALWLVPARFTIEATGQAQPRLRRHLYAPMDGEVVEVRKDHDDGVAKDEVVIVLRSRELESELQRLEGEYQTTQKKLLAITSARLQTDVENDGERFPGQLAAEEQELQEHLRSLQIQLQLVRNQRDQLNVRSPIEGQLLTWEPSELLADRPVQRGQVLVSVADLQGPWILELDVADRGIGHVLDWQQNTDEPVTVTFTLATGNSDSFDGIVEQISKRTEVIQDGRAATRIVVAAPEAATEILRPGSTIQAKVNCGRRSLGFVWFHEIVETLRLWFFF